LTRANLCRLAPLLLQGYGQGLAYILACAQVEAAAAAYEALALHEAVEAAVAIAARGNLLMEEVAPWTAFKKARPDARPLDALHAGRQGKWQRRLWSASRQGRLGTLCANEVDAPHRPGDRHRGGAPADKLFIKVRVRVVAGARACMCGLQGSEAEVGGRGAGGGGRAGDNISVRVRAGLQAYMICLQGSEAERAAAGLEMVAVLEAVRIVAILLAPVTPRLAARIHAALGLPEAGFGALRWRDAAWGGLAAGQAFGKPAPLFARLEGDFVCAEAAPAKALAGAAA